MRILVTGGAGYIGSHTCVELLSAGHEVVVVDSLANSSAVALTRVEKIAGRSLFFRQVDINEKAALKSVFDEFAFDSVIHFAGLKAVGESVEQPLYYYRNNFCGTVNLLEVMESYAVRRMVFSSSATVYGEADSVPIPEQSSLSATNPYGRSKLMIEEMLGDLVRARPNWNIDVLRYFNPVGAHESGLIGEDPAGIPNNLMPFIAQVAVGKLDRLNVFGEDWETPDGTGVRDYIHVVDLAKGHLCALETVKETGGLRVYNLGTGTGSSVHEVRKAFEKAAARAIPFEVLGRRPGDVAQCFADVSKVERELGWKATYDLDAMCQDAWRWQSLNPDGYSKV
ncbi:MAG: UDP-glucose 4-epimerase GalE [Myxococcota bacterium]|nr:UDP-glucose 4-epimerase GalE [Myxococcota bacterium]